MNHNLPPLLVKWLTHDLATPIATVMTASELLSDTEADAEINGLIADAARRLAARLRLIRSALAPGESAIGAVALEKLLREGLDSTPLTVTLTDNDGSLAPLITGAAMLLADLARGQPLAITGHGVDWAAPRLLPDAVAVSIEGSAPTDSRSALATMVRASAERLGVTITLTESGLCWS